MPLDIGRISGIMLKDNLTRDGVDLAFETDLIYLDVNTNTVGIKNNSASVPLDVAGTTRTSNLLTDTSFTNSNITIDTSRIITALGALNLTASDRVFASAIGTSSLKIDNNDISTTVTNDDIELRPNGLGTLEVYNDFNVTGSLHATGDITLDGSITFGNTVDDNIDFNADVNSDILPDQDSLYKLGTSATKRWNGLYTNLVNGNALTTTSLQTPSGVNYALRPGNIWFVATNGDNTNQGNHENGPFATIEKALTVATAGDSVYIYPGTYYELFPLVVPAGVTVKGTDLRSVNIVPDTASQSEDVFHLNGECTVSDLTIKDFYYDSINDKGYAFRFAPNFTVTTRSPYIQNITVITHGTSTTIDDPRGFASGDAGKGALVDGSAANYLSKEASMLFHSVTFITPGVDALTMTSGVRVEWLNSFTYFANRGLYATQGTGRLTEDGSTIAYGAEIRSIGSANVYGNYGAVADGANTLMYLIQHNFAYIGTGKDVSNDKTLVIQTNETVELNSGKIYYQSQDHTGTFRVGDIFYVDFEQGTVSFDASGLASTGATGLTITTGTDVTVINKDFVNTGNLKISGNTLESLSGPVNILAANTTTNLTLDVNIAKNLDVSGNFSLDGQLTLGNQTVDTVTFAQSLNQNLEPDVTETYNLGSSNKVWRNIYASEANINDTRIRGNVIETTVSNSDLELRANSAGIVNIKDSAKFDQALTVNGLTTTQSVTFVGTLNHLGSVILSGDKTTNGFMTVSGTFNIGSDGYFDNINIVNNRIFTTDSNSNLEISAAGTGLITVPSKNVSLSQNLTVAEDITGNNNLNIVNRVTAEEFYNNEIIIKDNYITTTTSNSNLELRGNSSGGVWLENTRFTSNIISSTDDIVFQPNTAKDLQIDTTSALVLPKGTTSDRPTFTQGDIRFNTGTSIFEGFGAAFGGVYSQDRATKVTAGSSENLNFTADNILTMDITSTRIRVNGLLVDNTLFDNNTVITTNNDLTFAPNGTGLNRVENITFDGSNVQNDLNTAVVLASTGLGYTLFVGTNGMIIPTGDDSQRPLSSEIGNTRYNVEQGYVEVWDGTTWNNAAGVGDVVTAEYMEDISYLWNLILG